MERLRIRNLLFACTVLLGLQFCFPIALHAGPLTQVAEMISLGTKDPETKLDTQADLALNAPFVLALVVRQRPDRPTAFQLENDDRESLSLLPVSGLHPSAP